MDTNRMATLFQSSSLTNILPANMANLLSGTTSPPTAHASTAASASTGSSQPTPKDSPQVEAASSSNSTAPSSPTTALSPSPSSTSLVEQDTPPPPPPRQPYLTGDPSVDFTPEVRAAIAELVPSNEHLDSPYFNPIEYINELLPNEQALSNIDSDIARLKMKIRLLDEDIYKQIRLQSRAGNQGKQDLNDAKAAITELFAKINDIKLKAEQSELMVQEICRDIKKLDYAKRHLTNTITALKRTHMLVTAVDQLKSMEQSNKYLHAGNLLEAVNQLSQFFTDYMHIPKIKQLHDVAAEVKKSLKEKTRKEFTNAVNKPPTISNASQLAEVCFVIDALGQNARMEFMEWFTRSQLVEYRQNFKSTDDSSKLEFIDRRFAWMKKELNYYDDQYAKIFPTSWKMAEFLVEEFCVLTKEMLIEYLEKYQKSLEVVALVQALQKTNDFERDMAQKFATPQVGPTDREKLVPSTKFRGAISSAFDKYMVLYINQEDKLMQEKFDKIMREEPWIVPEDEGNKVLTSSREIVFYFKQTFKRASALTKGQPLLDIFKLFKKYLYKYSEALKAKLPNFNPNDPVVKLNEKDEKTMCLIVNTADYCSLTTGQLVDSVKKVILESLVESVTMNTEQEEFSGVVAKGAKVLVYGLETKLDSALNNMVRVRWSTWEAVGDQSEYVTMIASTIRTTVPVYGGWLSTAHFKFFCDAFVSSFIPKLMQSIYKCKGISSTGAEQMLLDMSALSDLLKELPTFQEGATAPPRFVKFVKKEISRVEMLLKIIMTPQAGLVHSFKTLFPDGNEANFIKIMDLKSLKKNEQALLIENLRQYEQQMKAEKKAGHN